MIDVVDLLLWLMMNCFNVGVVSYLDVVIV